MQRLVGSALTRSKYKRKSDTLQASATVSKYSQLLVLMDCVSLCNLTGNFANFDLTRAAAIALRSKKFAWSWLVQGGCRMEKAK